MVNQMGGVEIISQMVDIMKDHLSRVYHMGQEDSLWKMGTFIKVKLSLVELMDMDIFKQKMVNIEGLLKIMLGMVMDKKELNNYFSKEFSNMEIENKES